MTETLDVASKIDPQQILQVSFLTEYKSRKNFLIMKIIKQKTKPKDDTRRVLKISLYQNQCLNSLSQILAFFKELLNGRFLALDGSSFIDQLWFDYKILG